MRIKDNVVVVGTDAQPLVLKGINFALDRLVPLDASDWFVGTCTELSNDTTATPVTNWYQEKHVKLMADIGFNSIRLNLNYRIFEDDNNPGTYKEEAWTFLDSYIQWAKNNDMYLVVDIHVPQGGLQPSGGGGSCLWDTESNQTRLINLWKAIAERYADETTIAAFDILNEPTPTTSASQWTALAQQIVDGIREVDANHMIIVERINWIMESDGTSSLSNYTSEVLNSFQVSVADDNTLYDFHFYDPKVFALQNMDSYADDGNYPDATVNETAKDGTAMARSKDYLSYEMGLENRSPLPMFVGEWGADPSTYTDTKGGLVYLQDTFDLLTENSFHWSYYSMFSLYTVDCCETGYTCCSGDNTTTSANQGLIDLLTNALSP